MAAARRAAWRWSRPRRGSPARGSSPCAARAPRPLRNQSDASAHSGADSRPAAAIHSGPRHARPGATPFRLRLHEPVDAGDAEGRLAESGHALGAGRRGAVESRRGQERKVLRRLPWRGAPPPCAASRRATRPTTPRRERAGEPGRAHQPVPDPAPAGRAVRGGKPGNCSAIEAYVACSSRAGGSCRSSPRPIRRWSRCASAVDRKLYRQRIGQLDLSCAQCHDDNAGKRLGGSVIPQAHPTGYPIYRLEWQGGQPGPGLDRLFSQGRSVGGDQDV